MLESKLRTGTSKTKKMQICLDEVALFWMSQWTACSPAWRILYHVTASYKGPIHPYHVDGLVTGLVPLVTGNSWQQGFHTARFSNAESVLNIIDG